MYHSVHGKKSNLLRWMIRSDPVILITPFGRLLSGICGAPEHYQQHPILPAGSTLLHIDGFWCHLARQTSWSITEFQSARVNANSATSNSL